MHGHPGEVLLVDHHEALDGPDEAQAHIGDLVFESLERRAGYAVALHDARAVVQAVLAPACLDLEQARGQVLERRLGANGFAAILHRQACFPSCADCRFAPLGRNLGKRSFAQALHMVDAVEACRLGLLPEGLVRVAEVAHDARRSRDGRAYRPDAFEHVFLVEAVHGHEVQRVQVAALREFLCARDHVVNIERRMPGKAGGRLSEAAELAVGFARIHVDSDLAEQHARIARSGPHQVIRRTAHGCGLRRCLIEREQRQHLVIRGRHALLSLADDVGNLFVHANLLSRTVLQKLYYVVLILTYSFIRLCLFIGQPE